MRHQPFGDKTMQIVSFGTTTTALPATGTVYSQGLLVEGSLSTTFDVVITGTPTGTLTLQQSGDGVNFGSYTATDVAISGAATSTGYNIQNMPSIKYLRVAYAATSGTGSMDVSVRVAKP